MDEVFYNEEEFYEYCRDNDIDGDEFYSMGYQVLEDIKECGELVWSDGGRIFARDIKTARRVLLNDFNLVDYQLDVYTT